MPTIEHVPSSTSRRVVRVLAVPVVLGVAWAALGTSAVSGAAETTVGDAPGPVAVAEAAELVVDATLDGTVERADERTLTVGGGVLAVPVSTDDGAVAAGQAAVAGQRGQKTAQDTTDDPAPVPATTSTATEPATNEPAATGPADAPAAAEPTPTPTVDPAPTTTTPPVDPSPTATAESAQTEEPAPQPTPSEQACVPDTSPSAEPEVDPTPTPDPTPTAEPESLPTDTGDINDTNDVDCEDADATGRPDDSAGDAQDGDAGGGGDRTGGQAAGTSTPPGGGTGGTGGVVEAGAGVAAGGATLTSIAGVGERLDLGSVAWTLDAEPVVVLIGDGVWYRDLDTDADDGDDVALLEASLVALGYGDDDLTVDATYTAATASAVEAWEADLGRTDPDGVVTTDEVFLLDAPATILRHDAIVGASLSSGASVLSVGGQQQVVVVPAPADEARDWEVGTAVTLLVDDHEVGTGVVSARSSAVEGGTVDAVGTRTLHVTTDLDLSDRPDGSAITVSRIADGAVAAVTVPVAALVADPSGTPAVRVVDDTGDTLVPVTVGLLADGRVEITGGIDAGVEVRLPG
ncbi:peptidoglycan-binding protein [Euzebya rosea]|uniref:peptidoglycan-binding protein n=1 Tax=Euzebya rosea TaxID=2052804 RepID=UPI000D3EDE63|nr:peptidoglycan-binding protein [Euzebya rosea]